MFCDDDSVFVLVILRRSTVLVTIINGYHQFITGLLFQYIFVLQ